ncbi:hypothetical protein OESDEN_19504 [Oesophagostomum dentatum]|uniref:Uncharacterized protein n=1 Tax=Oesophagostomum dentatum TaxID=61180 RepID=A0A0B1SA89_OESDE|nr:hypothetical protein OESDEN_19504 [Oesophagostomum dentatum]
MPMEHSHLIKKQKTKTITSKSRGTVSAEGTAR